MRKVHSNRPATATPRTRQPAKFDASHYLKTPPKTDFYLLFALLALFMTMVFM
jgi:hypothetical protein